MTNVQRGICWAIGTALVVLMAAFVGTIWLANWTSQREATIFASLSTTAFRQGFCDRALRLAVAGLPALEGAFPWSYRSPQLQGELALFASDQDCFFRSALVGHSGLVNDVAFSADGSRIVTASWDGTARVWDTKTGDKLAVLVGHKAWVNSAAFSPDGSRVVTASADKTARIWNAKTGALLTTLTGHTDWVRTAAFSPDGSRVVTAADDNTARVWDAETGALVATLSGHTEAV